MNRSGSFELIKVDVVTLRKWPNMALMITWGFGYFMLESMMFKPRSMSLMIEWLKENKLVVGWLVFGENRVWDIKVSKKLKIIWMVKWCLMSLNVIEMYFWDISNYKKNKFGFQKCVGVCI